tara:strand:- start:153308 stop:153514 length:207 start_codon:yes stop_codon:yes gene_type:complete
MRKLFIIVAFVSMAMPTLISCRETKEKTVIIEKEAEEEKGVLERAGEKVDKEVNKEIDKTIDNIENEE